MVEGASTHLLHRISKKTQVKKKKKQQILTHVTRSSDMKQHQMSTDKEVMITVKLWGVDQLHLHFDYHSESNS